jgi:mannose-1-phosphate guanylyltransferase
MSIKRKIKLIDEYRRDKANRYAVVLAGGDGTRLRSITKMISGDDRPKQFCSILGEETLLDKTRLRIAREVPAENTFFSLTRKHERFFNASLDDVQDHLKVIQPEGRGTAPAILYSLFRIAKTDPTATVAFFPSDHYFANDHAFMAHVASAFDMVEVESSSIVLLGIEAEKPETSYGWIEPAPSLFGSLPKAVVRVKRFWEKPTAGVAKKLMDSGCLWNSFVMIGRVDTFLGMFQKHLPELYRMFSAALKLFGTNQEDAVIRSIYEWIDDINFSSEVLEKCSDELLVMRVSDVGWSDWGEPERVIGTLNSIGVQPRWLQALAA